MANVIAGYEVRDLGYMECGEIVKIYKDMILGKIAACTSVDSGTGGWEDLLTEKVGDYWCLTVDDYFIENWPTYSGFYDEWYVFETVPSPFEVEAVCNYSGNVLGELADWSFDPFPNMASYLKKLHPVCIFGNNEDVGYIILPVSSEDDQ